jgi:hypothetical protein
MPLAWKQTISTNANVNDTLEEIVYMVNEWSKNPFCKAVVEQLNPSGDKEAFMHRLFNLACDNIKYKLDIPGIEYSHTPNLIFLNGEGDCKKFTIFVASILKAAGIEPVLKHVYYSGQKEYSHIYVIVPFPTLDRYITMDCTNECKWDTEVKYASATLYFLNGKSMELVRMGNNNRNEPFMVGLMASANELCGNMEHCAAAMGFSFGHKFHFPNLGKIIKQEESKVVDVVKKVEHAFASVSMAIPRAVFMNLGLRPNVAGLGGTFKEIYAAHPSEVNSFWSDFGGNPADLQKAFNEGAAKHPLLGPDLETIGLIGGPEAVLAAAAPIVAGAALLIAKLKPGSQAATVAADIANGTMTAAAGGSFDAIAQSAGLLPDNGPGTSATMPPQGQFTGTDDGKGGGGGFLDGQLFGLPKIVVFGGAAAIAAFFILKK